MKQLKRRADPDPVSRQPADAAGWLAPEVPAAPAPAAAVTGLREWLDQVSAAAAVVCSEAPEAEMHNWYVQLLGELRDHLTYVQHSGPEYFEVLQELVAGVLQAPAGRHALFTLPDVHQRVLLWLTAHNRRNDVLLVLADLQDNGRSYRLSTAHGAETIRDFSAELSYLLLLSSHVDAELLRLTQADLVLTTRLTGFAWTEDGMLKLGGWAYLPGVDPAECALEVRFQATGSDKSSTLAVIRGHDSRIDATASDRWLSYAGAAFTAIVDPGALPQLDLQSGTVSEWVLEVTLRFGGISVCGPFREDRKSVV